MNIQNKIKYPLDFIKRKQAKSKISVITVYDACFANLFSLSDIDALLVGDSLGMVIQGKNSTIGVTLEEMMYHSKIVKLSAPKKFVIADMPFGSYNISVEDGIKNAITLFKSCGVDAIKFEGADNQTIEIIKNLTSHGIPIMGHIGLEPQKYKISGGYKIQGLSIESEKKLMSEAKKLEDAGVFSIVLELVVEEISKIITEKLAIPTIGIGSSKFCDGQVLVMHDFLGLYPDFTTKHTKKYLNLSEQIISAANLYNLEIKENIFPSDEHSFKKSK